MGFNIFEKLLPPENKVFYDSFEDAAKVCNDMALIFSEALAHGMTEELVVKARILKHRGSGIERETINKLNNTFVTPIDREDIQALATMLNKITKNICGFAVLFHIHVGINTIGICCYRGRQQMPFASSKI